MDMNRGVPGTPGTSYGAPGPEPGGMGYGMPTPPGFLPMSPMPPGTPMMPPPPDMPFTPEMFGTPMGPMLGPPLGAPPPFPVLPEVSQPGMALMEEVDQTLLVQLRDGRILYGILRTFDQFSNFVLEDCWERAVVGNKYADDFVGLQIVRGENLVLMGRVDAHPPDMPGQFVKVDKKGLEEARQEKKEAEAMFGDIKARFDFLEME